MYETGTSRDTMVLRKESGKHLTKSIFCKNGLHHECGKRLSYVLLSRFFHLSGVDIVLRNEVRSFARRGGINTQLPFRRKIRIA